VRAIVIAASLLLCAGSAAAENVQRQPDIYAIAWDSVRIDRVNLTNDPAFDGWPAPSPDERRIAFVSIPNSSIQFGFPETQTQQFFGLAWNGGGRIILAST
jgi:hypothetical protein